MAGVVGLGAVARVRPATISLLLAALLVAAACSDGDGSDGDGAEGAPDRGAERGPAVAETSNLSIHDPFVPAPPADLAALYFTMVDRDGEGDRLLDLTAAAAGATQMHLSVTEGDSARMLPVEGGIVLPPRGTTVLEPGGLHVMLIGLTERLEGGDMIEVTLEFERAGTVTIQVPVLTYTGAEE